MLTSILGLRSPLASLISPNSLTLAILPSDSDTNNKFYSPSQPPSRPPGTAAPAAQDGPPSKRALATIALLTGTAGLAATAAVQLLLAYALFLSLFGREGAASSSSSSSSYMKEFLRADLSSLSPDQLARRAAMARDPRYAGVFLPLVCAVAIALPEEILKYLPVAWLLARRRRRRQGKLGDDGEKDHHQQQQLGVDGKSAAVKAATAGALGFALVELAGYVHAAASGSAAVAAGGGASLAVTLLERVFVSLPGHLAMAVLSASRGADADLDGEESAVVGGWRAVLRAVAPSVAYHALFDFILLGSSALVGGHVGWVHPEGTWAVVGTLGACVLLQGVLYAHTARAWLGWGRGISLGE